MNPIIQPKELLTIVSNENLVIIDASNGADAKTNYALKHIEKALYVDLNTQLSNIGDFACGGRHPLPEINTFALLLQSLGIEKSSHVVIYDDSNGANAAARFWWMLNAVGVSKVHVLDGGMNAAEKAGIKIGKEVNQPKKVALMTVEKWLLPLVTIEEVAAISKDSNRVLIDVRAEERFKGEFEPIDPIAGHIPGAINIPFAGNLNKDGMFLSPAELKSKYQDILQKNPVVYCGSGVTACHTALAMCYAGFAIPTLYTGSWSEWCRSGREIAKS